MLTLILGGARSGKSALGESLAVRSNKSVTLIATMEARDEEMAARIAAHRATRLESWTTIEEPRDVMDVALTRDADGMILLECVTMWVSNLLLGEHEPSTPSALDESAQLQTKVAGAVGAFADWAVRSTAEVVAISNDVGNGVVPPYPLGRLFRDCLGSTNQVLAANADRVYYLVAGLGFELKAAGARSIVQLTDDYHAAIHK